MTKWLMLILRGCLALGWTALLCLLLLQPEADPLLDLGIPEGENTLLRELAFGAVHLAAFAFTCSLWTWALAARFTLQASVLAAVVISLALGCLTELAQGYTPDRHASWLDIGANIAGALMAARVLWRIVTKTP
ncbi:MAG: VanZ family protein [Chloroflexi bacterium]|nr:VanZ family protein [Chloroflexota bacterium]